ncbi:hypothetical protein DASC09_038420 [Saccharomycopsis crataegensis]|uniref:Uncharacterized protein n=1 Tax=Saccharomycopsis crataegensis TaxID=43959 RepID=A0AAV5QPS6_9ASCO|nr:hypothetical protein DASC09_038420 [Saccharomycopsis crataegensis]
MNSRGLGVTKNRDLFQSDEETGYSQVDLNQEQEYGNNHHNDYQLSPPDYVYPFVSQPKSYNKLTTTMSNDKYSAANKYNDHYHLYQSSQDERSSSNEDEDRDYGDSDTIFASEMVSNLSNTKVKSTFLQDIVSNITTNLESSVSGDQLNQFFNILSSQNESYGPDQLKEAEVLQILNNKEKLWLSKLQHNISTHNKTMINGKDPSNVRTDILNNLNDLLQIFQLFRVYYSNKFHKTKTILRSFDSWKSKREEIGEKIQEIDRNINYSDKLELLENEHNTISSEIESLENKLAVLKNKRRILREEIDTSNSVIESEKSTYKHSLKTIERAERQAIDRLIKDHFVTFDSTNNAPSHEPALSERNIVDNLKLAFRKISSIPQEAIDSASFLEAIRIEGKKSKNSKNYYGRCVQDFEKLVKLWTDVYEFLASKERALLNIIGTKSSTTKGNEIIKMKLQSILEESASLLMDKINSVERQTETVSEIFQKVLLNELEAISNSLKLLDPNHKSLQKISRYIEDDGMDTEVHADFNNDVADGMVSLNINDNSISYKKPIGVERPVTPVLPLKSSSSSPPTTSFVTTFASGLGKGTNGTNFGSSFSSKYKGNNYSKLVKED